MKKSTAKEKVKIVEVGLRDGLQNEKKILSAQFKSELAIALLQSGLTKIEIGAFVSSSWVPQMADSAKVIELTQKKLENQNDFKKFTVLVPNENGFESALRAGVKEIAIFASCTESFSQKNINCSIDESYERFKPVMKLARKNKIKVRGYLSTCFGCPFEGAVDEGFVLKQIQRMLDLGVYEVSIGDTIGVANAGQVQSLFKKAKRLFPVEKLAGHFHDTRGQALANILMAYSLGVRVFDSSIGGLGGCPYAPGATGNVATEDVVYMFEGMNVSTGVDLDQLLKIHHKIVPEMDHPLASKTGKVGRLNPKPMK